MVAYISLRYLLRKFNLTYLVAPRSVEGATRGVAISLSAITISVLTLYSFMDVTGFAVLTWMAVFAIIYSVSLFINSIERIILPNKT